MAVLRPDLMMKCVVPVIMAGIIAIVRPLIYWLLLSASDSIIDNGSTVWSFPS